MRHPLQRDLLLLDVVGGSAVLASYALWIGSRANAGEALWGGIDGSARALYTVSMFAATAGFLEFTSFILRADPTQVRIGRRGFEWIVTLHALFLLPSALWMPLTFEYLATPTAARWWAVRLALAITGLASLGLVIALLRWRPRPHGIGWPLAVAGAIAFAFQTAVLDALIWPALFRTPL